MQRLKYVVVEDGAASVLAEGPKEVHGPGLLCGRCHSFPRRSNGRSFISLCIICQVS